MRWIWIDRFVEFESGKRARAIKNVSLAEEHLHDHFPGFPVMPTSLILEGMAQTSGILVGETHKFAKMVILAKVPKIRFESWVQPGEQLSYSAELVDLNDAGARANVTATVGERLVASAEIIFAHVDTSAAGDWGATRDNAVFTSRLLGVMDVGKAGVGDGY